MVLYWHGFYNFWARNKAHVLVSVFCLSQFGSTLRTTHPAHPGMVPSLTPSCRDCIVYCSRIAFIHRGGAKSFCESSYIITNCIIGLPVAAATLAAGRSTFMLRMIREVALACAVPSAAPLGVRQKRENRTSKTNQTAPCTN